MRVVALPSVYDRDRAARPKSHPRRAWLALAVGVLVPLAVAVVYRGLLLPIAALATAWAFCVGLYALLNSAAPVSQGEAGERAALRFLGSLPDDYLAIVNCKIPGYEQIGDLDIVVIGPTGVVVVEVKNYMSRLVVDGDFWTAQGRYGASPMKSVSKQLANEVKALSKFLTLERLSAPVHGIIAVNPNAPIQIVNPSAYPIVPYDALTKAILALPVQSGNSSRLESVKDRLERKLCS